MHKYLSNKVTSLKCVDILGDVIGKYIDIAYQQHLQHCASHL